MFKEDKILTFIILLLLFLLSTVMFKMYTKYNVYNIESFGSHKNIPDWREENILQKNEKVYKDWIKRDDMIKVFGDKLNNLFQFYIDGVYI